MFPLPGPLEISVAMDGKTNQSLMLEIQKGSYFSMSVVTVKKNRVETAMQITWTGSKKSITMHGSLQKKMQSTLSNSIYIKTHVVIVEKPILQF